MPDLRIDTEKAIAAISADLSERVARDGTGGVILGLSGGLDSSVLAALAVRALGPDAVRVLYLGDRDSDAEIGGHAERMARHLGLRLERHDISEEMRRRGVYDPLFIRLLRISALVGRVSAGTYRLICGESPFMSTLRVGRGEVLRPWPKRVMFNLTMRHVDRGFTERHQYRRAILERLAQERKLTAIGAANLSECQVGWFVKGGIDDLEVQPLSGLYKTQVRQLAEALDLPEPVRRQLPSPDMAKGVTDEFGIGHQYRDVDLVLDGIDRGLSEEEIAALGISRREIADIRALMRLSDWKRASPHEPPPVWGTVGGIVRIG